MKLIKQSVYTLCLNKTIQRIRGVTIMRYINLHFTYLLTYLQLTSDYNFDKYKTVFEISSLSDMGRKLGAVSPFWWR